MRGILARRACHTRCAVARADRPVLTAADLGLANGWMVACARRGLADRLARGPGYSRRLGWGAMPTLAWDVLGALHAHASVGMAPKPTT